MKKLRWIGSSLKDLKEFPEDVQREIGYALYFAQIGQKHGDAKPLKGIEGGIMEIVTDYKTDTFRTVYTVKIKDNIYVLHAFQKKSTKGIKTAQHDINLIKQRLKEAHKHSEQE